MNKMKKTMNCKDCRNGFADLLLVDGYEAQHARLKAQHARLEAQHARLAAHLLDCAACADELAELRATFALLDSWTAPEPSAYFDAKVMVGLREAAAAPAAGVWERIRSFITYSTGRGLRPAMAGALALAMVAGGGGALLEMHQQTAVAPSAAVNDLKILDNNAQAIQQLDQLLDDSDDGTAQPTT